MKLKLNPYWTKHLLRFPETGMGYQKVDVILKSGQIIKDIIILNAEDMVLPEQYSKLQCEEIVELRIRDKEGGKERLNQ